MNPYTDAKETKRRCKNPRFCIACFRVRKPAKVGEHNVCHDFLRPSTGTPKRLRAITLENGKTYFVDDRLRELRNIRNPCDRLDFTDTTPPKADPLP